jgi:uncharacterized protein (TIGR01777 family)
MKVAVTGATGLIGAALVDRLRGDGHQVVRLVRQAAKAGDEVHWDPIGGDVDLAGLAGLDAAVHLAGAGVGDRPLTAAYKRVVWDSRVLGTRTLVAALQRLDPVPSVLVCGSASGYYGDRGEEELTEDSPGGDGFMADLVRAWEAETAPATAAGIRVPLARTNLVVSRQGGAFGRRLLPLIRLGLAGPIGSGRQWWSWISLTDQVEALAFLLTGELSGPVNLAAPVPARNREVMSTLAHAVHRPALLPAPGFALRLVLRDFADEILASRKVLPRRLERAGFRFTHPAIADVAAWVAEAG